MANKIGEMKLGEGFCKFYVVGLKYSGMKYLNVQ